MTQTVQEMKETIIALKVMERLLAKLEHEQQRRTAALQVLKEMCSLGQ